MHVQDENELTINTVGRSCTKESTGMKENKLTATESISVDLLLNEGISVNLLLNEHV